MEGLAVAVAVQDAAGARSVSLAMLRAGYLVEADAEPGADGRTRSPVFEDSGSRCTFCVGVSGDPAVLGNGVAFSPDGTLIATASCDSTARTWDAATGTPAPPSPDTTRYVYSGRVLPRRHPHRHRLQRPHRAHLGHRHRRTPHHPHRTRQLRERSRVLPRRHPHRHRVQRQAPRAPGTPPPGRTRTTLTGHDDSVLRGRVLPRRHPHRHRIQTTRPRAPGTPPPARPAPPSPDTTPT